MTPNMKTRSKTISLRPFVAASVLASSLVIASAMMPIQPAWSAGDYSSATSDSALMVAAKKDIKNKNYQSAYDRLMAGIGAEPGNADLHNMLGFSARKIGRYEQSEQHYTKALAINPKHKQALEYMGELYLTLGQIDAAEALRERLDKICWLGCSELNDLDKAIADWKANNQS